MHKFQGLGHGHLAVVGGGHSAYHSNNFLYENKYGYITESQYF